MDHVYLSIVSLDHVSFLSILSLNQVYKRGYGQEECFSNRNWFKRRTLSWSKGHWSSQSILTKARFKHRSSCWSAEKLDSFPRLTMIIERVQITQNKNELLLSNFYISFETKSSLEINNFLNYLLTRLLWPTNWSFN